MNFSVTARKKLLKALDDLAYSTRKTVIKACMLTGLLSDMVIFGIKLLPSKQFTTDRASDTNPMFSIIICIADAAKSVDKPPNWLFIVHFSNVFKEFFFWLWIILNTYQLLTRYKYLTDICITGFQRRFWFLQIYGKNAVRQTFVILDYF